MQHPFHSGSLHASVRGAFCPQPGSANSVSRNLVWRFPWLGRPKVSKFKNSELATSVQMSLSCPKRIDLLTFCTRCWSILVMGKKDPQSMGNLDGIFRGVHEPSQTNRDTAIFPLPLLSGSKAGSRGSCTYGRLFF